MKKIIIALICLFLLCGCSSVIYEGSVTDGQSDLTIKDEDKDASYTNSESLEVGDDDIYITSAGTYTLTGELNGAVIVEVSKDEEVQLVLDNVTINNDGFNCIYIKEADKVTITLADGSVNTLTDTSTYTMIDENDVDATIFSKADLVINGSGTLNINANYKHGIVSKDDLIITSGTYNIDSVGQGICGKDCLKISDGQFNITSSGDALKSNNDEDTSKGFIYITGGTFNINSLGDGIYGINLVNIEGGTFNIKTTKNSTNSSFKGIKSDLSITISSGTFDINVADDGIHSDGDIYIKDGEFTIVSSDDAIHGDSKVTIDGGNFNISAYEGIEGTYITINDGVIYIAANDDGINAGQKVYTYTPTIEINGGTITIVMGQGDTDAIDSNGYIYVNGGTIDITAQSAFDYDAGAEYNGGTIIVNGTQVNTITNQMMGGQMGGQPSAPSGNMPGGFAGRR